MYGLILLSITSVYSNLALFLVFTRASLLIPILSIIILALLSILLDVSRVNSLILNVLLITSVLLSIS